MVLKQFYFTCNHGISLLMFTAEFYSLSFSGRLLNLLVAVDAVCCQQVLSIVCSEEGVCDRIVERINQLQSFSHVQRRVSAVKSFNGI